jgi:FkbM family methyltransferase
MRKIFLDCGAHDGCSVQMFVDSHPDFNEYEIYSFECDEGRFKQLSIKGLELSLSKFYPIKKAVWVSDGRKIFDGWQLKDTTNVDDKSGVESIDISKFILDNFSKEDYIVLKMDIEGAEYKVVDKMYNDGSLNYISKFYGELHGPKKGYSIEDNNRLLNQVWSSNLKLLNWDALEGTYAEIEIVPLDSPNSYTTASSPKVGHAYRKIMDKITFCIPSKSNLRYLKTCIPSIRENAYRKDHDIIVFVDSDEDGTTKWLEQVKDQYNLNYYVNPDLGKRLFGIGKAYDYCVEKSTTDIFMIFHADMMLGKNADLNAYNHLKSKTVVCATRVEPPIHPNAGEKILLDFGMWPEEWKKEEFNRFVDSQLHETKTTTGIFAPWMMYKNEFLEIGGHDPAMHSCREDSDVFNRMKLAGFNFIQPWNSLVYHLTGRGAGSFDGDPARHEKWKQDMNNSTKEFIRKWGSNVNHTPLMEPIVSHKYNIAFVVKHCNLPLLEALEPWCDRIYIEDTMQVITDSYIEKEQSNTKFDLKKRVLTIEYNYPEGENDIVVEFDARMFTQNSFSIIQNLSDIITESGEVGVFELDCFKITINHLETYEKNLIVNLS